MIGTTSKDNSARLGSWAASEEIVSLCTNLNLFEITACSENLLSDTVDSGLDDTTGGLSESLNIVAWNSASAE